MTANRLAPIQAELRSSSQASANGIVATGNTPVLALCRKLVSAGFDPRTPLEAYRRETLCLKVRSIGEAASLDIGSKGLGFVRGRHAVRTASYMRRNGSGVPKG